MGKYPYPLTICNDRYSGAYSGGKFTAWHLDAEDVPIDIFGDDVECDMFWESNDIPVGIGNTPEEAINDLKSKLR